MRRTSLQNAPCPIARSLDEIGDWWTMLIVRDAFQGKKRFSDFRTSLGLAKNILSSRLKTLVGNGILQKQPSPDGSPHNEYHLTEKGRRLRLVLLALRQWGEDNLFADGEPMMLALDRQNRPIARLQLLNEDGKRLELGEIVVAPGRKGSARATATKTRPSRVK
jgi:DNA-binding HxlR family transcriptional regulator